MGHKEYKELARLATPTITVRGRLTCYEPSARREEWEKPLNYCFVEVL
jgi:hypothetical protein